MEQHTNVFYWPIYEALHVQYDIMTYTQRGSWGQGMSFNDVII